MDCRCWGQSSEPEAQVHGIGPDTPAILEGWVSVQTSKSSKSRRLYARLTADALIFYMEKPIYEPSEATTPGPPKSVPIEMVLLTHMASVLGRSEGSEHVRVADSRGTWWQLQPEELSVQDWAKALVRRFDKFKTARRRSSMYTPGQTKELKVQLEAAQVAKSSKRRLLKRLASCVPCGDRSHDFSKAVGGSNLPYRGNKEGVGDLVDSEKLQKVTDVDLMEAQSMHWSDSAVRFLQKCPAVPDDLRVDFAGSVRKGVPDGLKRALGLDLSSFFALLHVFQAGLGRPKPGLIWPLAAGQALGEVSDVDAADFYNKLLFRSFGNVHPLEFQDPVPTFCQGVQGIEDAPPLDAVVKDLWLLKPQGQHILRRLLWVSQLTSHQIEFCPFLPNLMLVLLTFFSEAETMFIVSEMLAEEDASDYPRIILSLEQMQKQVKVFVREGKKRNNIPEVLGHLESLGNVDEFVTRLLQDGLASKLPFRMLTRVVGAFLGEGSEVIMRFGMAILKRKQAEILQCDSLEKVYKLLEPPEQVSHEEVEVLSKVAYSLQIKSFSMARVSSSWRISYAAPKKGYEKHLFCRPRLYEPRGNVPNAVWEAIWPWVPANSRVYDPHLIYVPVMDGTSLRTCLEKCKKNKDAAMVFFAYGRNMDIMGGFSPAIWSRTSGYLDLLSCARASEDAFVFRRLRGGAVDVYPWTGANQMLLQASEMHGLIFGGNDAAIHINKDLQRATSSASKSFNSPPLLETGGHQADVDAGQCIGDWFEIVRFEVFALK